MSSENAKVISLLKQILEELKPYDFLTEIKETVGTTQEKIPIPVAFSLVMCTPDGADMQISFDEITPSSYIVFDGSTYSMTRDKKKVKYIHAKAVSGSGMLRMSFWGRLIG